MSNLDKFADEVFEEAVALRREIHKFPEMAFEEVRTAELICKTLDKWGISYTKNVAKTGIVGLIKGKPKDKTLLLRADMDALPMKEETGLEFASANENIAHMCGHDSHVATLLAAAYILNKMKESFSGNVKLVFQPAEEGVGGALPMIEEGVMENPKVDAAVALHVSNEINASQIRITKGAVMAAPDEFDIIIKGRGGHGGHPDLNIDPIVIAAQFITCLQTIASRNIPPYQPVALSVTSINAGTNYNVIPDNVHIRGTARSVDHEIREKLPILIENMLKCITLAHGADYDFNFRYMYPPTINDDTMNKIVETAAEKIIGSENIIHNNYPSMGGEDFAYFAKLVPSAYFNLGIKNEEMGIIYPIHNSKFTIDETAIKTGSKIYAQIALDYLMCTE